MFSVNNLKKQDKDHLISDGNSIIKRKIPPKDARKAVVSDMLSKAELKEKILTIEN